MNRFAIITTIGFLLAVSFISACSQKNTELEVAKPSANESAQDQPQKRGMVLNAMHGGGYTYMQLDRDGQHIWVASSQMNVKRNDIITWVDESIMQDYSSAALHKTFDEIIFVTAASIENRQVN